MFFENIPELNIEQFQGKDLKQPFTGYLVVYAPWCGYCTKLKTIIPQVAQYVPVIAVNGDSSQDIVQMYGVQGFPTILVFKKGIFQGFFDGDKSVEALVDFAKKNLNDHLNPDPHPIIHGETYHPYKDLMKWLLILILVIAVCYLLYCLMNDKSSKSFSLLSKSSTKK